MQDNEFSRVFTINEIAKHYKGTALTASAIRRLVKAREIPSRMVGNKYLITAAAVENWINSSTASATDQNASYGLVRRVDA